MANINLTYWGLTGVKGTVTISETALVDALITAIATDEGLDSNYYIISKLDDPSKSSYYYSDSSTTIDTIGIIASSVILCTPNQLGTKEQRQVQKLDIAQRKRQGGPADDSSVDVPYYRILNEYNRDSLPTKYVGNTIVDNANSAGLLPGRPWTGVLTVPDIVRTNLQLYLEPTVYSGSGTSWTDSSTNAYTTTLVGAPAYNTTYFTFDGTLEYVDTNQSLASASFSIGCWFRTSAAGIKMLISKETTAGNPWNYRIWLNGGQISFDMSQVTTQSSLSSIGTTYNNGNWYYVMATRDDSNWYLYVNGIQVNTKADPYTGSVTNSQEVWFGRSAFTTGYQYTGDLGECFIYNRVLTASEILQNFNATKATYGL